MLLGLLALLFFFGPPLAMILVGGACFVAGGLTASWARFRRFAFVLMWVPSLALIGVGVGWIGAAVLVGQWASTTDASGGLALVGVLLGTGAGALLGGSAGLGAGCGLAYLFSTRFSRQAHLSNL